VTIVASKSKLHKGEWLTRRKPVDPDEYETFVICGSCDGDGCDQCHGTGNVPYPPDAP
jgi:hypothetical protein